MNIEHPYPTVKETSREDDHATVQVNAYSVANTLPVW